MNKRTQIWILTGILAAALIVLIVTLVVRRGAIVSGLRQINEPVETSVLVGNYKFEEFAKDGKLDTRMVDDLTKEILIENTSKVCGASGGEYVMPEKGNIVY